MSSSIAHGTGEWDAQSKTFTTTSEYYDPMAGAFVKGRDESRLVSDNEVVTDFYKPVNGKENKAGTMTFKRKK